MKNKTIIFLLIINILGLIIGGCVSGKTINSIEDCASPYTTCIQKNNDIYELSIYNAPVMYLKDGKYTMKDLSIVDSDKKEFMFMNKGSDIKVYFPKRIEQDFYIEQDGIGKKFNFLVEEEFQDAIVSKYVNVFGEEVEAVIYKTQDGMEIIAYSTISGIQFEYKLLKNNNVPNLTFECKDKSLTDNDGYITINDNKKYVIYKPLIYANNNELLWNYNIKYKKEGEKLKIYFDKPKDIDEIKVTFSIEVYLDKIPDSTAYSGKLENSYLRNYAVIGNSEEFGVGYHYVRFRLSYLFDMKAENILQAKYYVKCLNDNDIPLVMGENKQQWSSTKLVWDGQNDFSDIELSKGVMNSDGWISFDITQFVKNCINDKSLNSESIGCRIRSQENSEYSVVATSDNSLYVPYVKIWISALPVRIKNVRSINPE